MKLKHLIQFISVAVGNQFPNTISNKVRNSIHNQNSSCPAIFQVERGGSSQQKLLQEFTPMFQQIKQLLHVKSKHFQVNQPAYQSIASKQPTSMIAPNESILTNNDDGEEIKPILNNSHIGQLIKNSVLQEIVEAASTKDPNSRQNFEKMKILVQYIVSKVEIKNDQKDKEIIKLLVLLLDLVDKFAKGSLKVSDLDLDEAKMTMLQKTKNKKDGISEFIEVFATSIQNNQFYNCHTSCFKKGKNRFNDKNFHPLLQNSILLLSNQIHLI